MRTESLQIAIDKAAEMCGGGRALARRMGVPEHHPHEWRTGKRSMTPETAALLADVLDMSGDDARLLVAVAIVEHPKNAERKQRLTRALFASWAAGVVATLQTITPTTAQAEPREVHTIHIVARWIRHLLRYAAACRPLATARS